VSAFSNRARYRAFARARFGLRLGKPLASYIPQGSSAQNDPKTIASTIEDEGVAYDAPLSQGLSVNHSKTEGTKGTFLIVVVLDSDLRKERLPAPQRKEPDNDNKRD
jgi:hypothetical protein